MRLTLIAQAALIALPLLACASKKSATQEAPQGADAPLAQAATEAPMPEVRYYVIADT